MKIKINTVQAIRLRRLLLAKEDLTGLDPALERVLDDIEAKLEERDLIEED